MSNSCFVATVGAVYADGVSLTLPGTDEPSAKHYRGNAALTLRAGDRVKVTQIGSTYLVDYKIGAPGGAQ